jgi:hypothetical protein
MCRDLVQKLCVVFVCTGILSTLVVGADEQFDAQKYGYQPCTPEDAGTCVPDGADVSLLQRSLDIEGPAVGHEENKVAQSIGSDGAHTSITDRSYADAELYEDPLQRVWFLCKSQPPQPTASVAKAAGMASVTQMQCTRQVTFKGLCCSPWSIGLDYSKEWGMQVPPARDDSTMEISNSTVPRITLFTEQAAGAVLLQQSGATSANMDVTEVASFSEADLRGNDDLSPGEAVLRARIEFLKAQGLPVSSIPTCAAEVQTCPGDVPPATVAAEWLNGAGLVLKQRHTAVMTRGGGFLASTGSMSLGGGSSGGNQLLQSGLNRIDRSLADAELYADPLQRVWFMCTSQPPQPTSSVAKASGMASVTPMQCTTQMAFKSLCCLPWSTGLDYSIEWGMQVPPARDDSTMEISDSTVPRFTLFTEQAAGAVLLQQTGATGAKMDVTEVASFSEADLRGNDDLSPGEAVLRARIEFLKAQGLPVSSIPTCAAEVQMCPGDVPPTTVAAEWLNGAGLVLKERNRVFAGRGGGFLSTRGSFTLSGGARGGRLLQSGHARGGP